MSKVLFNTQIDAIKYQFSQNMWSEEPAMYKVLFNTQIDNLKYQFTKGMWSEEPGIAKVLLDIQQIVEHMTKNVINQKCGKDCFH